MRRLMIDLETMDSAGYSERGAHDAVVDARNQARAVAIVLRSLSDMREKARMYEDLCR